MRKKLGLLATGIVIALVSLGGTAPAFATDEVVEDQTENSTQGVCSSGWHWLPLSREGDGKYLVGPTQANFNGTNSPATMTFTSEASLTVAANATGSFNVGLSAKLASASLTYGTQFQASVTAGLGNTIQITVPPQMWGYGEYGLWSGRIHGEEQYWQGIGTVCNITQRRTADISAPFRAGWDTWTS